MPEQEVACKGAGAQLARKRANTEQMARKRACNEVGGMLCVSIQYGAARKNPVCFGNE